MATMVKEIVAKKVPVKKTAEEQEQDQEEDYRKYFIVETYLKDYCHERNPSIRFAMAHLHHVFVMEVTTGESILDLGCGPNVYAMIAASNRFKNIVFSEFVDSSCDSVRKWVQADADCPDFTGIFKLAAALEHNPNHKELEERLRKSVQNVIPCNVHLPNPLCPDERKFDVIVSNYVLEAANVSLESYRKSIVNVTNLLKPGGKFILSGALQSNFYNVGDHRFVMPFLTKDTVAQALVDAGFQPDKWIMTPLPLNRPNCDSDLIFMVISTYQIK